MKIISWNVNGLRAIHKKGFTDWLFKKSDADIICLQEIKSEKEQLPEEIQNPSGFYSFFNSSKTRKGYSGVAIYSKIKPKKEVFDIGNGDKEGRVIELHFDDFVLINCYFPNGGGESHRFKYKLSFYDDFLEHLEDLRKRGKSIVFCGDLNVAHEEIDLARPKDNEKNIGFLPEERAWVDELVYSGYVDVFRNMHPKKVEYSWWDMKTRARERNVGWRIDYFFVSSNLLKKIKNITILQHIFGSDHCPILLEM